MCGRYKLEDKIDDEHLEEQVRQAIRIAAKLDAKMKTCGDIRPTDVAPVIAPSSRNRALGAFPMQWGFTHPKRGMLVFNTRMETAQDRDMLAGSVQDRRCLVPASWYYEEDRSKAERTICFPGCGRSAAVYGRTVYTDLRRTSAALLHHSDPGR